MLLLMEWIYGRKPFHERCGSTSREHAIAAVFLVNESHQWFRAFAGMKVREASLEVTGTLQDGLFRQHCDVSGSRVQRSWLLTFPQMVENLINHDDTLSAARQQQIQPSQHDSPAGLRKETLCVDTLFVPEAPERLTLQFTEGTLLVDADTAIKTIREPRSHRIAIALNEFSTGHLSLNSLKNLPVDILKIDKTFIDDLPYAPRAVAIVDGVIRIAHDLGMQVIAEGVEHEAQLALLQALGCDVVQGNRFPLL